MTHAPRGIV